MTPTERFLAREVEVRERVAYFEMKFGMSSEALAQRLSAELDLETMEVCIWWLLLRDLQVMRQLKGESHER